MPSDAGLDADLDARLQEIREFVARQQPIVEAVVAALPDGATEPDIQRRSPDSIVVDGARWTVRPHGVGISVANSKGVQIEAHVGIFDGAAAFDAYRLQVYYRTLRRRPESYEAWQATLQALAQRGDIAPHPRLGGHFVLCDA